MLTPDKLLLVYVMVALTALALVVAQSELRRRRFLSRGSEDRIFRCGKCGLVYTDDPDVDRSRCSQCGTTNEPVTF